MRVYVYCIYMSMYVLGKTEGVTYQFCQDQFSRRIGELWEPFCALCWQHPTIDGISLFEPPLFKNVQSELVKEMEDYMDNLSINQIEKRTLKKYYHNSLIKYGLRAKRTKKTMTSILRPKALSQPLISLI